MEKEWNFSRGNELKDLQMEDQITEKQNVRPGNDNLKTQDCEKKTKMVGVENARFSSTNWCM